MSTFAMWCRTLACVEGKGYTPLVLALLRSSYEEPIVDIAKRIGHERLCFVMTPLTIHNKLVLMVAACNRNETYKKVYEMTAADVTYPGGRCTTTANTPGVVSSQAMGTVSTHRVKEPQR